MKKNPFTLIITVIFIILFIPVSFASESDTHAEGTEVKMLHAVHVFDANVTIGGINNAF